jgi:hypothetical protein
VKGRPVAKKPANNFDNLKASLFSATDFSQAANDAINKLTKLAKKGSEQAKNVLADYLRNGSIKRTKGFVCACLAGLVMEPHSEFAALFRHGLSDSELRYWSILGFSNSAGKDAYDELIKIANDTNIRVAERAHAIKCIARFSKQTFDRGLPADPGFWKETDLRLADLNAWANGGYQDGTGYSLPGRHPALDKPKTDFEKIVSRLDKKLGKQRQKNQDSADPTDWLTLAAADDIAQIKVRWKLPSTYLDFLIRFSPKNVIIESRKFYNPFQLFGAGELIEAQDGYSFNSVEQQPIEDWPAHLIVIASHGGDPFVLDLSKSDGKDAPVDTAEHGMGDWEFSRVADSFSAFLETLAK